jgi:hypothetical protein
MRRGLIGSLAAGGIVLLIGASAAPTGVFRDITKSSGIRLRVQSDMRHLKMIGTMFGGCAFGDYDGDGLPDLYVTNSVASWGKKNQHCGRLYRNLGGGRFEDVTQRAGIHACGLGMGAFWADLDNDGRLDLYLTNVGPNRVYWNRGDGTFEEGKDTGLEDPLFSVGAGFLDYDGDGRVDVVVANYLDSTPEWELAQPQFELRVPEDYRGQPSHLYRNEGGRKFRDVTRESGLLMNPADTKTLGVAVLDYDGDGRPDLYFGNDRTANRLFHNRGDGTFEETTAETGAGALGTDHPRAAMGIAVGDPFGEGRPSVFVTNFSGEPNSLYRNEDGLLFEDAGDRTRAGPIGLPYVRWGTHFADFDNDGWPDLYTVGGHLAPRLVRMLGHYRSGQAKYIEAGDRAYAQKTLLLHNRGGNFEEWADSGDLGQRRMSGRGSAVADIDGDGDLDLFIVDIAGPARLFENVVGSRNSWLRVEPRIGPDGRTVLGTEVRITAGGRSQTRWLYPSPSYASGSLTDLHFGLGKSESVDELRVTWPGGDVQTFHDLPARRVYSIARGGVPQPGPRTAR